MAGANLNAIRLAIDEFNAGEMGRHFDSVIDARVDYRDELGEFDNREDVRAYLVEFREMIGGLHVEWEEAREIDDTVVLMVKLGGRGEASGVQVEQRFTAIMSFEGGRCTRWHFYADHAEALEAAGLRGRQGQM